MMDREEFERVAQEVFDALPAPFRGAVDNVRIVVGERPGRATGGGYRPGTLLLGLYEGVPLTKRDSSYGAYPVVPDTFHERGRFSPRSRIFSATR